MLRICYAEVGALSDEASRYVLSEYRRERLAKQKPLLLRQQGIGAELLLNALVSEHLPGIKLPLDIITAPGGKPCLSIPGLYCSLSHSGGLAACAVSDREIGLDVQILRPYSTALARRFFTEAEQRSLAAASDPDRAYTMLWALKESWLKATGEGLRTALDTVSFQIGERITARGIDAAFWHTQIGDAHFAVCVPGQEDVKPDLFCKRKLP